MSALLHTAAASSSAAATQKRFKLLYIIVSFENKYANKGMLAWGLDERSLVVDPIVSKLVVVDLDANSWTLRWAEETVSNLERFGDDLVGKYGEVVEFPRLASQLRMCGAESERGGRAYHAVGLGADQRTGTECAGKRHKPRGL